MFYACAVRFDVTENLKNFTKFFLGTKTLFSSKFFGKIGTVALLFVFYKYCPIMD